MLSRIRLAALSVPGPGAQHHLRLAARPGSMKERPVPGHGGLAGPLVARIVLVSFGRRRGLPISDLPMGEEGDIGRQVEAGPQFKREKGQSLAVPCLIERYKQMR